MRPELERQRDQHLSKATAAAIGHLRPPTTLARFLIVAGIACVINQFALSLLCDLPILPFLPAKDTQVNFGLFNHPDVRLLLSSALAVEAAILFQFNPHERCIFRERTHKGWALVRFLRFKVTR